MAHSCTDDVDEGCASLDAEDYALLGLVVLTDQDDDRQCDAANACSRKTPYAEVAADTCTTSSNSLNGRAPTPSPTGSNLVKQTKRRGTSFIDLTGVPPQPLILKNQLSATCYQDNSRRRPIREGSSKYTGVHYNKESKKWRAQLIVQGKLRFIGYYDKEGDAAADYARAVFKYKPKKQSLETYGGMDLSGVPNDLPLIRSERCETGYVGVKLNKERFQVRISIGGGKTKTLGTFDTAEEAALIHARAKFYLDRNGRSSDLNEKKEAAVLESTFEEASAASEANSDDEDPVDPCFIVSAGDKIDGVAV